MNSWFIDYGFKPCETDSCLYFYDRDGISATVLLYFDNILCVTMNVKFKQHVFKRLSKYYGFEGQGLLNKYSGVQVDQKSDAFRIHQMNNCEEIIERFDFSKALQDESQRKQACV